MRALVILVLAAACSSGNKPDLPPPPVDPGAGGEGGRGRTADAAAGPDQFDAAPGEPDSGATDGGSLAPDGGVDVSAPAPDGPGRVDAQPGGASLCPSSGFAICESFEETDLGAVPANWTRRQGYGGKMMGVAADDSMRGQRSLRIQGGVNGSQFMEYTRNLGTLASSHWGRIFFKVKTPAPWPTSGVLHGDIVEHIGPHPGGGTNGVRWGIVENTQMKFQWIYDVQPSEGEPEFGDGTAYNYSWPGTWQCLEWRYDQPTQQGMLWIDGEQIPITVGKSHAPEIPVFTSLGVGWANYQNAPGEGFTVWIDEVAIDKARIGCTR
jgi:hypothetical protein